MPLVVSGTGAARDSDVKLSSKCKRVEQLAQEVELRPAIGYQQDKHKARVKSQAPRQSQPQFPAVGIAVSGIDAPRILRQPEKSTLSIHSAV